MNEKMRMGVSALLASSVVTGGVGLAYRCSSERTIHERAEAVCGEVTRVLEDEYGLHEGNIKVKGAKEQDLNSRVKSGMVYFSSDCKKTFCTGFIYDEHTIVSCGHCLESTPVFNNTLCIHFVGAMKDGSEVPGWTLIDEDKLVTTEVKDYRINLVKFHPDALFYTSFSEFNDVGILSVKENLFEVSGGAGAFLPVRDGNKGLDSVRAILSSRRGFEGAGLRKLRDLTFAYDVDRGIRFDHFAVGGDSGTPVSDFKGNVVGLVCYSQLPSMSPGNPLLTNYQINYLKKNGGVNLGDTTIIDIDIGEW